MSSFRSFLAGAALLAAVATGSPAVAQRDPGINARPDGTVSIRSRAAALGIGYNWGGGVLNYHGRRYRFRISGVSVADVGYAEIAGRGRVYHLRRLQDFNGTYAGLNGQATVVQGLGGQILRNGSGVEIRVDEFTRGARLTGAADGITLTLVR